MAPLNWRQRVTDDRSLMADWRKAKLTMIEDYIGMEPTRSIVVCPEDPRVRVCRENQERREARQEKRKRGRPGGEASEGDCGSVEHFGIGDGDDEVEGDDIEGEGVEGEEEVDSEDNYAPKLKKRPSSGDDGDDDDGTWVKVPRNLLHRLTPLAEKMGLSMRNQLGVTVGIYEILGLDSTKQDLSLSSTWRTRKEYAAYVADDTLKNAMHNVMEANAKVFVHFDKVEVVLDMAGKKEKKTRLVILISSPAIAKKEQLLCAVPMEERTGAAIAKTI